MTDEVALEKIENLKPISKSNGTHVYKEVYEVDGYLIIVLWTDHSKEPAEILKYKIEDQFFEDKRLSKAISGYTKVLPTSIWNRMVQKEKLGLLKSGITDEWSSDKLNEQKKEISDEDELLLDLQTIKVNLEDIIKKLRNKELFPEQLKKAKDYLSKIKELPKDLL